MDSETFIWEDEAFETDFDGQGCRFKPEYETHLEKVHWRHLLGFSVDYSAEESTGVKRLEK